MRFLVDECTGPTVARWLQDQGHDVFSVYEEACGMDDRKVIQKALAEQRILITNDKDFGERIYRERQSHRGVILLRLENERVAVKIDVLRQLLSSYADRLADQYVVVTENARAFCRQMTKRDSLWVATNRHLRAACHCRPHRMIHQPLIGRRRDPLLHH